MHTYLRQYPLLFVWFLTFSTVAMPKSKQLLLPSIESEPVNQKTWLISSHLTKSASERLRSRSKRRLQQAKTLLQQAILVEPANARARMLLARISDRLQCRHLLEEIGMKQSEVCIYSLMDSVCGTADEEDGRKEEKDVQTPALPAKHEVEKKFSDADSKMCEDFIDKHIVLYPLMGYTPPILTKVAVWLNSFPNPVYHQRQGVNEKGEVTIDSDMTEEEESAMYENFITHHFFDPHRGLTMISTDDTAISPRSTVSYHMNSRALREEFDGKYDQRVNGFLTCDADCCSLLREKNNEHGDVPHYLDEVCFTRNADPKITSMAWHSYYGRGD